MSAKSVALIPMSLILMSATPVKESPAAEMLQKLGALEGRWEGSYAWTGARDAKGPIAAEYTYALIKGSVTEELFADGKPYMTSVYHLDEGSGWRFDPRALADAITPTSRAAVAVSPKMSEPRPVPIWIAR